MDTLIANELEEGERVLWTGRPHPSSRANNPQTRVFAILAIIYGILGIILLIVGFTVYSTISDGSGRGGLLGLSIVGGVFVLLAIIFGIVTAVYRPGLKGTVYAITEQRILTVTTGRALIAYSYGKGDIGPLTRIERQDGTGDLIFTTNRQGSPYGMYGNGYYGAYSGYGAGGSTTTSSNMAVGRASANAGRLLGIPNVREVERIVRRTFK
jgi:hypothetical protein